MKIKLTLLFVLSALIGFGQITFQKTYGGTGDVVGRSVRQTSDGGYIVTGSSDSFTGVAQILLAKFDGSSIKDPGGSPVGAVFGGVGGNQNAQRQEHVHRVSAQNIQR